MAKMEEVLKAEIGRLARKTMKGPVTALKKNVQELRQTVSELKKKVAVLEKRAGTLIEKVILEAPPLRASEEEAKAARMSAKLIKKLRKRLGLNQSELGVLVGVSLGAVTGWESGRGAPRDQNKAALVALRKLGRRDVKKMLEEKGIERKRKKRARKKKKGRKPKQVAAEAGTE